MAIPFHLYRRPTLIDQSINYSIETYIIASIELVLNLIFHDIKKNIKKAIGTLFASSCRATVEHKMCIFKRSRDNFPRPVYIHFCGSQTNAGKLYRLYPFRTQ